MKPLISAIIPAYNAENFLRRAVDSVLNQAYKNWELFIVDDASTDKTVEIAEEYAKKNERINYVQLEQNSGGAAKPKNEGIKLSKGRYVAVLDVDDEWMPEKLEKQLELFENANNSNLGFAGCNGIIVYENGREVNFRLERPSNVLNRILEYDYMGSGSSTMYKKEVFDKAGLFDEELKVGQDRDMRIRLAQKYDFDFVDGVPLYKYYRHAGNISKQDIREQNKYLRYFENKHKHLYRARPKVYSNKLRYDGTRYMLAGSRAKAWESFVKSIGENPLNLKTYIYLSVSLLGRRVYFALTRVKQIIQSTL